MKAVRSIAAALMLVLLCGLLPMTALAEETAEDFNAKLDVVSQNGKIYVTVVDSQVLKDQQPRLTIPCEFEYARVIFNGQRVASTLENGQISFRVSAGGTYIIEEMDAPGPTPDPDPGYPTYPIYPEDPTPEPEPEPEPEPWANPYTDVPEGWYYDAVRYVTEHGLMGGAGSADTFQPTMTTTRGMIVTILARMNGVDTTGSTPWYQKGVEWAVASNVSDGTNPEKDISRQELVTMLWRYVREPASTYSLSAYPDAAETAVWAKDAMKWAVENGIITHTGEGLLNPTGSATRMEVATVLMRFCENLT